MKRMHAVLQRHQTKLWLMMAVVLAGLVLNVAAQRGAMSVQWEYKVVAFQPNLGDNVIKLETVFGEMLNRESAAGWEYTGRCAHINGRTFWVDYVVFRRPR